MNEENEDIFADILGDKKLTDDDSFEKAMEGKEDIFDETDEQDEEKPAKSQPEKEEKEESPSQEGEDDSEDDEDSDDNTTAEENTPFHKRWAKREQKLKEDFNKKIEDLEGKITTKPAEETDVQMPQWFKTLAGDDEIAQSAFKQYQAETTKSQTDLKKQWVEEQKQEIVQQKQDAQKWDDWVDDEVDRLKAEGKKFKKDDLLNIAVKYTPTGDDGQISLDKAYDIYVMQKASKKDPAKLKQKKAIVADSDSTSGPEVSTPIKNLRTTAWSDLTRE